jgi:hypothetical protein
MLVLVSQVHQGRCDLDGDANYVAAQPQAYMSLGRPLDRNAVFI